MNKLRKNSKDKKGENSVILPQQIKIQKFSKT